MQLRGSTASLSESRGDEPGTHLDGYRTSGDHPQCRGKAPEASWCFGVRTKLHEASTTFGPPPLVAIKYT
jgi:hypothetical protein